jgi:hypothetical protein
MTATAAGSTATQAGAPPYIEAPARVIATQRIPVSESALAAETTNAVRMFSMLLPIYR